MAQTESTMPALGLAAANFHLPDVVSGATVGLDSFAGKRALLVMFISRHCPYVQHVKHELARLGKDYAGEALGIVAISPNYVVQYPDDAPELLKEMAAELGLNYPICYDETQEAAKAYDAACTPDFFLFDAQRRLVYRGQLDSARPRNDVPGTGAGLWAGGASGGGDGGGVGGGAGESAAAAERGLQYQVEAVGAAAPTSDKRRRC